MTSARSRLRQHACSPDSHLGLVDAGLRGFSLVELLVSVAVLGIVLAGLALPWRIGSAAHQQSRLRNIQDAAIDEDVAFMEDIAYRYTCCPGLCTIDASVISSSSTCKGVGGVGTPSVGSEYYYFPYYSPASVSQPRVNSFAGSVDAMPRDAVFEDGACHGGQLVQGLVTLMQVASATDLAAVDLTRSVAIDDAGQHRVRLTYSGAGISRVLILVPAVAGWCP